MDTLTKLYGQYSTLISTNPIVAAALVAMVIGSLTGVLRSAPGSLFSGVKSRFVSTLTLKLDSNWENREVYGLVTRWLYGRSKSWSKSYAINRVDPSDDAPHGISTSGAITSKVMYKLRCGVGTHFFFHEKKLFWYNIEQDTGGKSESFKETLALKCFSFSPKPLEDLVNVATYQEEDSASLCVYQHSASGYRKILTQKRPIGGVVSTDNIGNKILNDISEFVKDKEWTINAGIPYKVSFLLHGIPGTGKTSLIRAVATTTNRSIYIINVRKMSDDNLIASLTDVEPGSILVFEDIDCLGDTFSKRVDGQAAPSPVAGLVDTVSLSGMLNTLDGLIPLNNMIVFMTTNHIEKIDSAILRKGRTDYIYEVKPLDSAAVSRFAEYIYGSPVKFSSTITGAELQHLAIENKHDFEGFKASLSKLDV